MKVIDLDLWKLDELGYYDFAKIGWIIAEVQKEFDSFLKDDILICTEMRVPVLIKTGGLVHVFSDIEGSLANEMRVSLVSNRMIHDGYRTITRQGMITYLGHYQNEAEAEKYLLDGFMLGHGEQMITFRTEGGSLGAYMKSGNRVVIASRIEPYSKVLGDSMKVYQEILARSKI